MKILSNIRKLIFPLVVSFIWTICIELFFYSIFPSWFISYYDRWGSVRVLELNQFEDVAYPVGPIIHVPFIILSSVLLFSLLLVALTFFKKKFPQTTLLFISAIQSLLLVAIPIVLFEPEFFSLRPSCPKTSFMNSNISIYESDPDFCAWNFSLFVMRLGRIALLVLGVPSMSFIILKMRVKRDLITLQKIANLSTFFTCILPIVSIIVINIHADLADTRLRCRLEAEDPKAEYGKLKEICPTLGYKVGFIVSKWTMSAQEHRAKYPYR